MLQTHPQDYAYDRLRQSDQDWDVDWDLDKRANKLLDALKRRDGMSSHVAFCNWMRDFDLLTEIDLLKVSAATLKRMERM